MNFDAKTNHIRLVIKIVLLLVSFEFHAQCPSITQQPQSYQSICVGGQANIEISVSNGAGTPSYQWYSNTVNSTIGGTPSGSFPQSNTYLPGLQTPTTKYYYCIVSSNINSCPPITSNIATVQAFPDPIIIQQPLEFQQIIYQGGACPLIVNTAGGAGNPNYDWRCTDTYSITGGSSVGDNNDTLIPPSNILAQKYYHCDITFSGSGCSALTSNIGVVSIGGTVTILEQPVSSQSVCTNSTPENLVFSVANFNSIQGVQWYYSNSNSYLNSSIIPGATNFIYNPPTNISGTKFYYCKITYSNSSSPSGTSCYFLNSALAQVIVNPDPTVTISPTLDQTLCVGGTPNTLTSNLNSSLLNASYTWYINSTNNMTGAAVVENASNSTFTPSSNTAGNFYYFVRADFTNTGCSSATSNGTFVSVVSDPIITTQPINATICGGGDPQPLTFNTLGGAGTPTYQWYSNLTENISNGTIINGATTTTYDPPEQSNTGNFYYFAVVNFSGSGCNSTSTNSASISVVANPSISIQPISDQIVCLNSNANSLTINLSNLVESATFNWYFNGSNSNSGGALISVEGSNYAPPTSAIGLGYYYCTVDFIGTGCSSLTSNVAAVNTLALPSALISETALTACEGYSVPLSIMTDADIANSYFAWYSGISASNILPIANTNNPSLQISLSGSQLSYMLCSVTNEHGCTNYTDTCVVQSLIQPQITELFPSKQNICIGGIPLPLECTLASPNASSNLEYFISSEVYEYGGISLGNSGENYPEFSFPGTRTFFAVYELDYANCTADTSNFAVVTVFDDPVISFNKDELEFACINYNGIEVINSNPALIGNYSWYINDTIYSSGTSSNLATQGIQPSTQIISAMAVYEEAGCDTAYTSTPLSITFIPEPSLSLFEPQQSEFCIFDELQDSLALLVNTEIPSSQVHYQWLVSESEDYSGASPISNATFSYYKPQEEEPGNFYYFCRVDFEDTYCESLQSDIVEIKILPPSEFCFEYLPIPNAISPNGDSFNDFWDLSKLQVYETYKVDVWNQFGQQIFSGNEKSAAWDGKYQGQNVPVGDYYYQIEIPMVSRTFSGTIGINY